MKCKKVYFMVYSHIYLKYILNEFECFKFGDTLTVINYQINFEKIKQTFVQIPGSLQCALHCYTICHQNLGEMCKI